MTPDLQPDSFPRGCLRRTAVKLCWFVAMCCTVIAGLALTGCKQDVADASIDSNANGYYCRLCQAKMFTDRRVFLDDCPKCGKDGLVDAIGYWCETDEHLTIRPMVDGSEGASVCEKCGVTLKNAMVSPSEEDLVVWGATKAEAP